MKHLLKIVKPKKSSKLPPQPISLGNSADISPRPSGFAAEQDAGPEGERCGTGPRIVSLVRDDEDQENPALEASTSGVVIRGGTVANEGSKDLLLGDAREGAGGFGPLKVVLRAIPAVYANHERSIAVGKKVQVLLSRVVALEECFDSRPGGVAEQRSRGGLIHKFKDIEGKLSEKTRLKGLSVHAEDGGDVFRLLEDLQETIFRYQMTRRTSIADQRFKSIDPAEAIVLNNFRYARQAEYRHCNRASCLKGTRSAVLDEIELWTRDFDRPPVYWLNGLAGTGKTTIAQTVAERIFVDGRLGASFFCSRDFEDRRNLQYILPTLAVQLARKYAAFRLIFVQLVQSDPEIVNESLYGQMDKLIVQPLVQSAISTVIVIDALDECRDTEPASAILFVLGQFVAKIPKVKLFVTGRPEPRIREGFRLPLVAEATDVLVLHEVKPSRVNSDVQLFFAHNFSELKRRQCVSDDWPTEEQVDLLCQRAAGLFVYAMATIRFIDQPTKNPKKQLIRLLQSLESVFEGRTRLTEATTLDSLYMSILQEAFKDHDQEDGPDVRSVLGAVILATNPLSPSTIATLLGFDAEDVSPLLSSVHSLLIFQKGTDHPVRPFHKSFPDFIVDPTRCTNPRFRVCPSIQHGRLLVGCLDLMNRTLEQNMCKLPDGVVNSEVGNLTERTEKYIGKALEYACRSWHKHLIGKPSAQTLEILHQFLTEKFLFWLEVLSVMGAAGEAVGALETTTKWLDESPTLNISRDFFRFIITFLDLISTSAPHIYISALPLSPQTSMIREIYNQYARPLVRVVHGLSTSWEPVVATAHYEDFRGVTAWSPCNRLIAVARPGEVEIRDAGTLMVLNTLKSSSSPTLLAFSPDSRLLTHFSEDSRRLVTWDLQTGGSVDSTFPEDASYVTSSTSSLDGKMLAAVYSKFRDTLIATCDLSTTCTNLYRVPDGRVIRPIWNHGEFLRFATVKPESITIWQVELTLTHPPEVIESFPAPGWIDDVAEYSEFLFLPSLSRLAIALKSTLSVWDVRGSELLLCSCIDAHSLSFSSDGRLFACVSALASEIRVWKESPAGYILHQQFPTVYLFAPACLSPNGESILVSSHSKIHLRHTKDPILPSHPKLHTDLYRFILGFSPDELSAAFARIYGRTVTVLDLQSGHPQLTIDTGIKVRGLGVTGSAIAVVDGHEVRTWSLTVGDARAKFISDVVQITTLDRSRPQSSPMTSLISPDLSRVVTMRYPPLGPEIFDASTGRCLTSVTSSAGQDMHVLIPWFTPDGCEVWGECIGSSLSGWQIIEDSESSIAKLQPLGPAACPSGALPWQSSRGYEVTDDGWILSYTRKRLLWLPHRWRSSERNRTWSGRFLGLWHAGLPEIVILEFSE